MLNAIQWDSNLIRRYDQAGPRYTSYPTAVQFHERVSQFDLLHALRDSRKAMRPLSLYVHIPFCAHLLLLRLQQGHHQRSRARPALSGKNFEREIEITAII